MCAAHVRRTCVMTVYTVAHVRRACVTYRMFPTTHMFVVHVWAWLHYYCGHALFFVVVMVEKLSTLAAVGIIIIRRRRRRRETRLGREWSRDWLKKRQSDKGMDELIMAELAVDVGGFQHNFK